jgi:4-amino-4-deoxy-L-arabinose transferase-like glycosyltransferase
VWRSGVGWPLPVLLFLAALAVRLALLGLEPPARLVGDEKAWISSANAVRAAAFDPLRAELAFYPPLHPYLIAAAQEFLGGRTGVKVAQSVLGALLVFPVFSIGGRLFDRRVGATAAAVAALYPELVWQSVHFWSEPLFMCLLWGAVALLLRSDARGGRGAAALAGVLLGLAALTRDPALYFAPLAAAWLAIQGASPGRLRPVRSGALLAAVFVGGVVLVVAPWTARNQVRFGVAIPVSLMGARTFWEASAGRHDVIDEYTAIEQAEGPLAAYRHAWREGLASVRQRQPWWLFEQLGQQIPQFWTSNNLVLIQLQRRAYAPVVTPSTARAVLLLTALPHVVVTAAFLVGLVALPLTRGRALLLLFLAYYQALHVVTLGHPRLRLPVLPVVFVFAAAAFWGTRDGSLAWTPLRRVAAALLLLAFAFCLLEDAAGFRLEPVFAFS